MSEPKDDLVERLRGYAAHKVMCNAEGTWIISGVEEKLPCTCGLSTLLASIKEQ